MSDEDKRIDEEAKRVICGDVAEQCIGLRSLRKILAVGDPPVQKVLDTGLTPKIIDILNHIDLSECTTKSSVIEEILWILTNLTGGNEEQTQVIVDAHTIEAIVPLLNVKHEEILYQTLWTLGNISSETTSFRQRIIDVGAFPLYYKIMSAINENSTERPRVSQTTLMRYAVWSFSNLCQALPAWDTVCLFVPLLAGIMKKGDMESSGDACWALSHILHANNGEEHVSEVIAAGATDQLAEFVVSPSKSLQTAALRLVCDILDFGTYKDTQNIANSFKELPDQSKIRPRHKRSLHASLNWRQRKSLMMFFHRLKLHQMWTKYDGASSHAPVVEEGDSRTPLQYSQVFGNYDLVRIIVKYL